MNRELSICLQKSVEVSKWIVRSSLRPLVKHIIKGNSEVLSLKQVHPLKIKKESANAASRLVPSTGTSGLGSNISSIILEKTDVARMNSGDVACSGPAMDSSCEIKTLKLRMREDRDPEYNSGWPVRACSCIARIKTPAHENP
jgi:hypothetical protein